MLSVPAKPAAHRGRFTCCASPIELPLLLAAFWHGEPRTLEPPTLQVRRPARDISDAKLRGISRVAVSSRARSSRTVVEEEDDAEERGRGVELWTHVDKIPRLLVPLCALGPVGALVAVKGSGVFALTAATGVLVKAPIVVSGLSLGTKALYEVYACMLAAVACSVWTRFPDEQGALPKQVAVTLAGLSLMHLGLSAGLVPHALQALPHADIVGHFVPQVIAVPAIARGIGYMAGQDLKAMLPTMALGSAAMVSLGAAHIAQPPLVGGLFVLGVASIGTVLYQLNRQMPTKARAISPSNYLRVQISTDLWVYMWIGHTLVDGFSLASLIADQLALKCFVVLDAFGTLGVMHLFMRDPNALGNATNHLQAQRAG